MVDSPGMFLCVTKGDEHHHLVVPSHAVGESIGYLRSGGYTVRPLGACDVQMTLTPATDLLPGVKEER
jgi:hypothetical protein